MKIDQLKAVTKDRILEFSKKLSISDVRFLVETLNEKDDMTRYNAFLLLQSNSRFFPFVYDYWSVLEKKLEAANSYQRSIGAMLIAENVKWDKDGRFRKTLGKYMDRCNDEKFITARQSIQGLGIVLQATCEFDDKIKEGLANLQLSKYKENQKKLLKKDIKKVLQIIEDRSVHPG